MFVDPQANQVDLLTLFYLPQFFLRVVPMPFGCRAPSCFLFLALGVHYAIVSGYCMAVNLYG